MYIAKSVVDMSRVMDMLSDGSLLVKCSASLEVCNEKIITALYIKMLFTYSHFLLHAHVLVHVYYMYVGEECCVRKGFTTFAVNDAVTSFSQMSYQFVHVQI